MDQTIYSTPQKRIIKSSSNTRHYFSIVTEKVKIFMNSKKNSMMFDSNNIVFSKNSIVSLVHSPLHWLVRLEHYCLLPKRLVLPLFYFPPLFSRELVFFSLVHFIFLCLSTLSLLLLCHHGRRTIRYDQPPSQRGYACSRHKTSFPISSAERPHRRAAHAYAQIPTTFAWFIAQ